MSRHGTMQTTYTKSGLRRYYIEIWHDEMNKYQLIRGEYQHVVDQKARDKMKQWDEMWHRKHAAEQYATDKARKLSLASDRTAEAQNAITELENILSSTLTVNDAIDWELLKDKSYYAVPFPHQPKIAREPQRQDAKYQPTISLIDRLFKSRKQEKQQQAEEMYLRDQQAWEREKVLIEADHERAAAAWQKANDDFIEKRDRSNAVIDQNREAYLRGDEDAVLSYFDLVLSRSSYPDYFPQSFDIEYNSEGRYVVVDYQLPDLSLIPTVRTVKYVQSRDEFTESSIPQSQINKLYDDALYQVALRTLHEFFESDQINSLAFAVFNGYVTSIDPATGQEKTACVLSVHATRDEFEAINLANVDPRACFMNLKGVSSSRLHSLTPIAPIMQISREDKRFIDSYAVADGIDEKVNLAAMDWEDFEHLVREVFEKEFASTGGEVKVTRASRDGGIDAVAFDPDPIRGGKLVIQAKRYTNVVGVSAIRDLYGSVINEGAAKGIIVTTAHYGPDAYEFAKGKPLTLLDGSNLLYLLEKHGHKAKIDVNEAKRMLSDKK